MADYREISQGYAQGGIKAATLINGAAAIAVLSQMTELTKLTNDGSPVISLSIWSFGVFVSVITWVLAFNSTRFVDNAERSGTPDEFDSTIAFSNK